MKTTIEQKEPCLINIHIELPPEHFEKEWKRIGDKYQKFADIPGFRKGKAPRASIEKKYAQEMKIEVIEHLTEDSLKMALEEHQIKIIGTPEFPKAELRIDHSFYFLVTVMIRPEIKLKASDYSELEITVKEGKYDVEEMLQKYLETMQKKFPEYINIEDRGLTMSDIALIDYNWDTKGSEYLDVLEDNPVFDAGFVSDHDYWHEMEKEKDYIPGFSEALLGMKPNEVRKFEVTFPDDFREDRLRGITVFYKVTLYAINIKEILPIDDKLANAIMLGYTLKELKQETRQSLKNSFEKRAKSEAKEILKEKVIDNIPCEIPSPLVDKVKRGMSDDFIKECKDDGASSKEIKSALEYFEPEAEEAATKQLQWMFIAKAIAKKESFELTDEEFYDYIDGIAEERGVSPEELFQELKRNGELSVFHEKAMEEKVLEFIYSKTKIIKVPAALPKKKKLTAMETMERKVKKIKKIV